MRHLYKIRMIGWASISTCSNTSRHSTGLAMGAKGLNPALTPVLWVQCEILPPASGTHRCCLRRVTHPQHPGEKNNPSWKWIGKHPREENSFHRRKPETRQHVRIHPEDSKLKNQHSSVRNKSQKQLLSTARKMRQRGGKKKSPTITDFYILTLHHLLQARRCSVCSPRQASTLKPSPCCI